jgi:putative toxin-antitoxin system antitoxin component (TIGR02293 family)
MVYLHQYECNYTIMETKTTSKGSEKRTDIHFEKFSPAWVVVNSKDALGYKLELINRIRNGVKKADWKELINKIGSTEKEFEAILPASISSMQKKTIYSKETSERIYELARLFGLGYEVFDSKADFKNWLMTPSKSLGNKKPFELLDSSLGFEMVESEIVRIQYNVYS